MLKMRDVTILIEVIKLSRRFSLKFQTGKLLSYICRIKVDKNQTNYHSTTKAKYVQKRSHAFIFLL